MAFAVENIAVATLVEVVVAVVVAVPVIKMVVFAFAVAVVEVVVVEMAAVVLVDKGSESAARAFGIGGIGAAAWVGCTPVA